MRGRSPALTQPVRQADVVGVHVGRHDPQDWQAFQFGGKQGFPLHFRFRLTNATIDDRPALDFAAYCMRII